MTVVGAAGYDGQVTSCALAADTSESQVLKRGESSDTNDQKTLAKMS